MNWPKFGGGGLLIYLAFVIALAYVRGSFSRALIEGTVFVLWLVILIVGIGLFISAVSE
ncbi:hypothetical protein LCGC14_0995220 [marine sediment metagenome]|uniref:Uncharacterized protein n=1 Tax=marine sediment metagenome TaxID=412755 RepID=A0A0F9N977_9ZZZZ